MMYMKKQLFTILMIAGILTGSAQIIITNQSLAPVGTSFCQANDTSPGPEILPGDPGPDKAWYFSTLQEHSVDTLEFMLPAQTPYGSSFPFSNFSVRIADSGYAYFNRGDQELSNIGVAGEYLDLGLMVVDIEPKEIFVDFPAQYGDTRSESFYFNVVIGSPIPGADSVRFKRTTDKETHIDAYGSMTLAVGTYEVLRVREDRNVYDSTWAKVFGFWMFLDAAYDEQTTFSWWSDDPSIGYTLCSMRYDEGAATVEAVSYLKLLPVGTAAPAYAELALFPNPASDYVNLRFNQPVSGMLRLHDLNGRLYMEDQIWDQSRLHWSLSGMSRGVYLLQFVNTQGATIYSGKLLIR